MSGVTMRALRHYDTLGLLRPAKRTEAGYRLYGDADLLRLQQILLFRELDFPLDRIKKILDDPGHDTMSALASQIEFLNGRSQRYARLSRLASDTLAHLKGEKTMKDEQLFEGFDYDKMMKEQQGYEQEVQERWGNTDAYRISKQRAAKYTKEDWARIAMSQQDNLDELGSLYTSGVPAEDERIQNVVKNAISFINDNFYPCNKEFFTCLGEMYVTDPRFTAYYDKRAPGLAAYYNKAIQYYCKKD
jgi:DNA-binding transcriptional MerR regulator